MKELIKILNEANHAYYNLNDPIMNDQSFDKLYDELLELEKHSRVILSNSPTQKVGYEVVSKLEKVSHEIPLLSLNKTKSIDELKRFIGNQECVLMLKMDGLTTKLIYEDSNLLQASTRGNGQIGEIITSNVKTYKNVPLKINHDLTVVGESIITYQDFNEINSKIHNENEKYKNPRNLASGSVRQLDSKVCAERNVRFIAYGFQNDIARTKCEQLEYLESLGFEVVPYVIVNKDDIEQSINDLKKIAEFKGYPIDGMVITFNDLVYNKSLGTTSKYPRGSIAYKFSDEICETTFRRLDYSTTRTGQISIVAEFDPVEIDGTEVTRASLHNVDIAESLQLSEEDLITVYKANQIIPQVKDNLTRQSKSKTKLTDKCPSCGGNVEIRSAKEARFLYCVNDNCSAKLVQKIVHFASRDCMNIVGLSEATIEKFVDMGFVEDIVDLYYLDEYEKGIKKLDGFGKRSYDKLIEAIEQSKNVDFSAFINSLGISNVGKTTSKILAKHYDELTLPSVDKRQLRQIDDIGEVVANSIYNWFDNDENNELYHNLLDVGFNFKKQQEVKESSISGKTFVVTGSVNVFKNRKELQKKIEEFGGKVSGSISKNTDYLINNDAESNSSKNVSAKKLGVPIISENDFIEIIGGL